MELTSIDGLEIYVDREVIHKNGNKEIKRVPLNGDLKIGEYGYFKNSSRNKIKKINENKYIFCRFDEIHSHVYEYQSNYNFDQIKDKIINNLDYNLEYGDERSKLVNNLIEQNQWIYDLISTNRVIGNNIKTSQSFLSEDTEYGKIMDVITSYVTHPKFKNKEDKEKYDRILTKSKEEKNKRREKLFDSTTMTRDSKVNDFGSKDKDKQTIRRRIPKQEITNEDIDLFFEIREIQKTIEGLEDILGYKKGFNAQKLKEIHKKIEKEKGKRYLNTLRNTYADLNSEILIVKEKLRGTIYFKRLDHETTEYDFESDTGYIDENGDYKLINQSKIEMNKKEHIIGLIKNYVDLKGKYKDKFNHSMWAILWVLDWMIENAGLNEKERFVFSLHKKDCSIKEIAEECQVEFREDTGESYISRVINNYIPTKLHKFYLDSYDEWLYTYKKKGKFKKCNKCGEIKLINNDRYFRKRSDKKGDGFYNQCRLCEK